MQGNSARRIADKPSLDRHNPPHARRHHHAHQTGDRTMRAPPLVHPRLAAAAAAASLLLAACSAVPLTPSASPSATAPVRATASTPTLAGGYKKVASAPTAAVYFVNLKNGDTVSSPVLVQFGLRGIGVAPAGVEKEATGHHHLLIDVAEVDVNAPLPATDNVRHFGGGQTEVSVALPPGRHTLQLLLADHNHIPHHPVVISERITITVR
jgi:hypothetical protein